MSNDKPVDSYVIKDSDVDGHDLIELEAVVGSPPSTISTLAGGRASVGDENYAKRTNSTTGRLSTPSMLAFYVNNLALMHNKNISSSSTSTLNSPASAADATSTTEATARDYVIYSSGYFQPTLFVGNPDSLYFQYMASFIASNCPEKVYILNSSLEKDTMLPKKSSFRTKNNKDILIYEIGDIKPGDRFGNIFVFDGKFDENLLGNLFADGCVIAVNEPLLNLKRNNHIYINICDVDGVLNIRYCADSSSYSQEEAAKIVEGLFWGLKIPELELDEYQKIIEYTKSRLSSVKSSITLSKETLLSLANTSTELQKMPSDVSRGSAASADQTRLDIEIVYKILIQGLVHKQVVQVARLVIILIVLLDVHTHQL